MSDTDKYRLLRWRDEPVNASPYKILDDGQVAVAYTMLYTGYDKNLCDGEYWIDKDTNKIETKMD